MLKSMGERIGHLHPHDALTLLCHSLAIPKLLHILRTAPCFLSSVFTEYDSVLQDTLSAISNIKLSDVSWMQATLLVKSGGLGIRSAVNLASSAFLASAEGSADLVQHVVLESLRASPVPLLESAKDKWREGQAQPPPAPPASYRQKM